MNYPTVLDEDTTIDMALKGCSLARYGDGELRIVLGGTAAAQRQRDARMSNELRQILALKQKALVCIPNIVEESPKYMSWRKYKHSQWVELYKQPVYGSAFITRPDSAPWINRKEYWDKIRQLWSGRAVVLVIGTERSLTTDVVAKDAKRVTTVRGPGVDAYAEIGRIEKEIMQHEGVVILCLGPTATILAARLATRGRQALDLGHVGMFMRRLGLTTI